MGGAEFACQFQPVGLRVDRDDRHGAGELGGHDGTEPHGAGAEHSDAGAGSRLQLFEHGAGAGADTAAERAHQVVVDALGDFGQLAFERDGVGRPRGLLKEPPGYRRSVQALERGGAVQAVPLVSELLTLQAVDRAAAAAVHALTAKREPHDDAIAGFHQRAVLINRLDDTGAFMTQYTGRGIRVHGHLVVQYMPVGSADPAAGHANQNLVGTRSLEFQVFDADLVGTLRAVFLFHDRGLYTHVISSVLELSPRPGPQWT